MSAYIVKRLLMGLLTLVGVSVIIFVILRVIPGDPALMILVSRTSIDASEIDRDELIKLRKELGTDKPIHVQYMSWIKQMATGDLGRSLFTKVSVAQELRQRFPFTLQLALLSVSFAAVLGISLGVIAAVKQNTVWDYVARLAGISGITMPVFWSATLIILFLVLAFSWIPPLGYVYVWDDPKTAASQIFWPALALGYYLTGIISRLTRAQVLEILRQDYIRTARAKGLQEQIILIRHALRNAMLPVVTIIGLQFAALLSGTVLVERIFHIPGLGSALVQGVANRDYPMVQALLLWFAAIVILVNLMVDLLYSVLDPRIRYS